jgi:hypothetical protein
MADNLTLGTPTASPPTGTVAATRERSDSAHVPVVVQTARTADVKAAVSQSATVVELLAANADRAGFVIENDSESWNADLLVKFGADASLTDYTRRIKGGDCWDRVGGYAGQITGIWTSPGAGKARVTEEVL